MATGEWILVNRRGSPNNNQNHHLPPPPTNPYKPYLTQPTYAQMVVRQPPLPQTTTKLKSNSSSTSSKPTSPHAPTGAASYISPHIKPPLRFPPSPTYTEWKGRCFRCCRMGHNSARCRNLRRCGKCWGEGHIGSRCRQVAVSDSLPSKVDGNKEKARQCEPKFDDILASPIVAKPLPEGRPKKITCFVERDEEYYEELAKLEGAVIMYNPDLDVNLSIEQVAQYAAKSGLVKAEEVSVAIMTRSRYTIMLPHGIVPDDFIKAIPIEIWQEGYTFYQWTPLDDASKAIPHFKVLIDLVGIPLDLYRKKEVIRATSAIGTYLGTIEQTTEGDITVWTVVVATTDLSRIPHQVAYMVGGFEKLVDVIPKTWIHVPLYKAEEMVQPKDRYKPVIPVVPFIHSHSSLEGEDTIHSEEDEVIPLSRSVLEELCRGRDEETLPASVRVALTGEKMKAVTRLLHSSVTKNPDATCAATPLKGAENPVENPVDSRDYFENMPNREEVAFADVESEHHDDEAGHFDGVNSRNQKENSLVAPQEISPTRFVSTNHMEVLVGSNQRDLSGDNLERSLYSPRILEQDKAKITANDSCPRLMQLSAKKFVQFSPRVFRPSTTLKRKKQEEARKAKAQAKSTKKQAEGDPSIKIFKPKSKEACLKINEDGLVEVQVNYNLCSNIAAATGFQTEQVIQVLKEDNEARFRSIRAEQEKNLSQEENISETFFEEEDIISQVPVEPSSVELVVDQGEHISETNFEQAEISQVPVEQVISEEEMDRREHISETDFEPDSDDELDSDFE